MPGSNQLGASGRTYHAQAWHELREMGAQVFRNRRARPPARELPVRRRRPPSELPGCESRPCDFNSLRLDELLKVGQPFWVVPDLPRGSFRIDGLRHQSASRLPNVPFDWVEPVAAVGDMRHSEVLAGWNEVL